MEGENTKIVEAMPASPLQLEEKQDKDVTLAKDESNMDPKKLRRVLASRQYSQKYRMKQLQYILQLEKEVKALQAEVAITSPRLKYADRQNCLLRIENRTIKQRLSAFSSELMFKEAQCEELQKERDVLNQFHMVNHQLPEMFKAPAQASSPNNNHDPPTI